MPAKAVLIRFPDGDYEYEATRRDIPSLGETMRRKGQLWTVTRITGDGPATVHVEPVPGESADRPERRAAGNG
jgi:hypothetical protein